MKKPLAVNVPLVAVVVESDNGMIVIESLGKAFGVDEGNVAIGDVEMQEGEIFVEKVVCRRDRFVADLVPAKVEHSKMPVDAKALKNVTHSFGCNIVPVEIKLVEVVFIDEELLKAEGKVICEEFFAEVENFQMFERFGSGEEYVEGFVRKCVFF